MYRSGFNVLALLVCISAIPTVSHPSVLLHELVCPTPQAYAHFGKSLAGGGDVNGDRYVDIVVGAPDFDVGAGLGDAGKVFVYSGKTGSVLRSCTSPNTEPAGRFGSSVAIIRDINVDYADDIVIGAPNEDPDAGLTDAGRVYVFSGLTGAPLMAIVSPNAEIQGKFGFSVAAPGDVDLDGVDDILVGAIDESSTGGMVAAGRVYLFSGDTGSHLRTFESPNAETDGHFGFAIAGAGHTNDDVYPDVIVGAPFEDNPGSPESTGRAYLFDGGTGLVRFSFDGFNTSADDQFGYAVAGGSDSNGDGYDDVVVGAPGQDSPILQMMYTGWVYRYSGLTGQGLPVSTEIFELEYGYDGLSVACVDDYDRDGLNDIAFGVPGPGPLGYYRGFVDIISADSGLEIDLASAPTSAGVEWFGGVLASVGDVNDDWYSDFASSSHRADMMYAEAGRAWVFGPAHPTISVSAEINGTAVELSWNAVAGASEYWIYGAENEPFFVPQAESPFEYRIAITSGLTWLSLAQTGDETSNWTYLVVAVNSARITLCKSDYVGEFDREISLP